MASFHLLMYGHTVLADTSSMIGNLGFRTTPWRLKSFADHWEFQAKYVHHGDNKVRFNRFKDLRDEDIQWIMNIWHKLLDTIYEQAQEKRKGKITEEGMTLLKDGRTVLGKEAVGLGIVDQAIQPEVYLYETMPKNELGVFIPTTWEKLGFGKNKSEFELPLGSSFETILDDLDVDERNFLEIADQLLMEYFLQTNLKVPEII